MVMVGMTAGRQAIKRWYASTLVLAATLASVGRYDSLAVCVSNVDMACVRVVLCLFPVCHVNPNASPTFSFLQRACEAFV